MTPEIIDQGYKNLLILSDAFEKAANDPKYYNTDFSYYLDQFSHQLYRDAQEMKDRAWVVRGY